MSGVPAAVAAAGGDAAAEGERGCEPAASASAAAAGDGDDDVLVGDAAVFGSVEPESTSIGSAPAAPAAPGAPVAAEDGEASPSAATAVAPDEVASAVFVAGGGEDADGEVADGDAWGAAAAAAAPPPPGEGGVGETPLAVGDRASGVSSSFGGFFLTSLLSLPSVFCFPSSSGVPYLMPTSLS